MDSGAGNSVIGPKELQEQGISMARFTRQLGHHQPMAVSNNAIPVRRMFSLYKALMSLSLSDGFQRARLRFATFARLGTISAISFPVPPPIARITGRGNHVII